MSVPQDSIELGGAADLVPRARRFVVESLRRWELDDAEDSAALVVTELVTNALLYAGPPVRVGIRANGNRVRVSVTDRSRVLPVRPRSGSEGMTGRGLALVDALCARWGVDAQPKGKVVWAELTPESSREQIPTPPDDIDALLAAFDDDLGEREEAARYTVTLGDVPTDLLLASKQHIDSLAREFTLAAAGADSGLTASIPQHLAALVETVVSDFGEARQAIKRQALDAAAHGQPRTCLVLRLPVTAADAGERYLAALDEADAYARAARLLTLAAPPQHRAFRTWYVTALVNGLREAAAGREVPEAPSFESFLLGEIDTLAELHRKSDRAARLQRISAALAAALDPPDVGDIILAEATGALGARRGTVWLPNGDPCEVIAAIGYSEVGLGRLRDAGGHGIPAVEAMRTGEPVWIESREDRDVRYPLVGALEPDILSACALPLVAGARTLGALGMSFIEPRLFDEDERRFLAALAAVAAQTLERAALYQEQADTADRLRRLQQVAAALGSTREIDAVADVVIGHATRAMDASVGSLCLLGADGHTLELVRTMAVAPDVEQRWRQFDMKDDLPASEAVRNATIVFAGSIQERDERWPAMASLPYQNEHALVCVPLVVDGRPIGALTLSFPGDRRLDADDREFVTAMADACAQALDRAHASQEADVAYVKMAEANTRLSFLADASAELASSLDYERTLARVAELAVPRLADWCTVHVVENDDLRALAIAHVDPERMAIGQRARERYPERLTDEGGVGRVIRTGEAMFVPEITDDMLASGARDAEHLALLRQLGFRSVMVVPLAARERVFGAVTMILAESGRSYAESDLQFARELANRAALAIDNARLFRTASEQVAG